MENPLFEVCLSRLGDAIRRGWAMSSEFERPARAAKALDPRVDRVYAWDMRLYVILALLALVAASCARQPGHTCGDGPAAALVRVIDIANRGREEDLARLVAYTLVADFDENLRAAGTDDWSPAGKRDFWKKLTRNRTVGRVLPRDERISGEYAFVRCDIVYLDGSREELRAELKLSSGAWIVMVYPTMLRR